MTAPAMPRLKAYRNCKCTRQHKTYRTWMRCAYPRAAWVQGEGQFALIAWCHVPTISLWDDQSDALKALDELAACGGRCVRRHEVVRIVKA